MCPQNWKASDLLQKYFSSKPSGDGKIRVRPELAKCWQKQGPLDVKKLLRDEMLFLQRYEKSKEIIPIYSSIKSAKYKWLNYGQLSKDKRGHGIVRRVNRDSLIEGQFVDGKGHGWVRKLFADGRYYVGWFKSRLPHGYGKLSYHGKIQEGLFEDGKFVKDNKVSYDLSSQQAQRFDVSNYILKD